MATVAALQACLFTFSNICSTTGLLLLSMKITRQTNRSSYIFSVSKPKKVQIVHSECLGTISCSTHSYQHVIRHFRFCCYFLLELLNGALKTSSNMSMFKISGLNPTPFPVIWWGPVQKWDTVSTYDKGIKEKLIVLWVEKKNDLKVTWFATI